MVLLKQLLQDLKAWYPQISSFSLVLVQAGACAAGPGEGFLLELDGNANLQVGGKVPKVAIALTRFSILGLQA